MRTFSSTTARKIKVEQDFVAVAQMSTREAEVLLIKLQSLLRSISMRKA